MRTRILTIQLLPMAAVEGTVCSLMGEFRIVYIRTCMFLITHAYGSIAITVNVTTRKKRGC